MTKPVWDCNNAKPYGFLSLPAEGYGAEGGTRQKNRPCVFDSIRYAVNEKPGILRQGVLWLPEENDAMAASLYIEDYLESIEKKKEEIRRYEHAIENLRGLVVTES